MSEHYRYRAYFCLFLFWFSLYNKLIPLIRCTIYLRKLVSFWLTEIIGMQFFPGDRLSVGSDTIYSSSSRFQKIHSLIPISPCPSSGFLVNYKYFAERVFENSERSVKNNAICAMDRSFFIADDRHRAFPESRPAAWQEQRERGPHGNCR